MKDPPSQGQRAAITHTPDDLVDFLDHLSTFRITCQNTRSRIISYTAHHADPCFINSELNQFQHNLNSLMRLAENAHEPTTVPNTPDTRRSSP